MRCLYCHPAENLIIKSFKNFHVVIDPYPMCVGHMMIISKEHYGCIGEMPPSLIHECEEISIRLSYYLENHFNNSVLFEHGRAGICAHDKDGTACSHMHLHVIPAKVDISSILSKRFTNDKVSSLETLRKYFHGFGEYLFFHAQGNKSCYFLNSNTIPPHYLRTVITEARGEPHLNDWENYADMERIQQNFEFLQDMRVHLEKNIP